MASPLALPRPQTETESELCERGKSASRESNATPRRERYNDQARCLVPSAKVKASSKRGPYRPFYESSDSPTYMAERCGRVRGGALRTTRVVGYGRYAQR